MSELYIHCDTLEEKHHFYLHVIMDSNRFRRQISFGMFHNLINAGVIDNSEHSVTIFEIDLSKDKFDAVYIQHATVRIPIYPDESELEEKFRQLLLNPRRPKHVIQYEYEEEKVHYMDTTGPIGEFGMDSFGDPISPELDVIFQVTTNSPFLNGERG